MWFWIWAQELVFIQFLRLKRELQRSMPLNLSPSLKLPDRLPKTTGCRTKLNLFTDRPWTWSCLKKLTSWFRILGFLIVLNTYTMHINDSLNPVDVVSLESKDCFSHP